LAVAPAFASEPSLETYSAADGTTYFAASLSPNEKISTAGPRDIVILVDTSASQAGRIRERSLAALDTLLTNLDAKDRVQLLAIDLDATPLTKDFRAVGSEALNAAVALLKMRTPLGATDLAGGLRAGIAAFASANPVPRTIVYIGDGRSSAKFLSTEDYRVLCNELADAKVSVSSYGVGPRVDGPVLASLANMTGGMLALDDDSMDPKQAGSYLAHAVRGSVLWPTTINFPKSIVAVFPERMPPLRSDRETIVLGQADGALSGPIKVEVAVELSGKPKQLRWELNAGESNPDFSFLPVVVEAARTDGGARLITVGKPGLDEARRIVNADTHLLGELSRQALISGNLPTARRLADEALQRDPQDEAALAVKKQLSKLSGAGPVAAKTSDRVEVKEFSNEQATPPPAPPAPAEVVASPATGNDFVPDAGFDDINEGQGRLLENIEQHNRLMTDLIRTEVEESLRNARAQMETDPLATQDDLKLMLGRVLRTPELRAEVRASLRGQLEAALREAARRGTTQDIRQAELDAQRAASLDRMRIANNLIRKEEKIKQLMDRFNSLMEEGRYLAADEIGSMEVARLAPELPIAQQAALVAHMTGARQADLALRMARQKAVIDTLGTVEVALMPFPDDQPVVYPPADEFQELTNRRKKYASTDLKKVSPAEQKIRAALEQPTRMEFIDTPLQDAVNFLKDYHQIEIQLDTRALEDLGVGTDSPVSRNVNGITLKSGLRLMLGDMDLTYIIKDEVLLITTQDKAESELVTKAYPVADLVIPVQSMGGMGGGMMGGGMMGGGMMGGGMMGGMGGGMMGGMGGGMGGGMMGGMGGGMFSVPDDLKLGPKSKTTKQPVEKSAAPASPATNRPAVSKPTVKRATEPAKPAMAINLPMAAGADPNAVWAKYFASNPEVRDADVRETVRQLMRAKKYDETVGLIQAALRAGNPQPWMYDAVALAMQAAGHPAVDVERALMSGVDFSQSSNELMYVAQYLARTGFEKRALQIFEQVSKAEPLRPEPYLYGLQLSQRLNDADGIRWSSLGILKQAWPKSKAGVVEQAKRAAEGAIAQLKNENQTQAAEAFQSALDKASVRDCIVKVTWTGDADIDVMVEGPSGEVCTFRNPRTADGGVLLGESSGDGKLGAESVHSETYECPEAFAGTYRAIIRRVWGKVTAGKVTVDLYAHYGTPQEKHMHDQVVVGDQDAMVVFDLPEGRRKEALAEQQLANATRTQLAMNQAIVAQKINEESRSSQGANASLAAARRDLFGWPVFNQAVGYQPVITVLPSGTQMRVSGVVSADRRYVRVSPMPTFSGVSSVTTFNLLSGNSSSSTPSQGGTAPGTSPPGGGPTPGVGS
jgi:hypothetical protein